MLDADRHRARLVWPATMEHLEGRFGLYGRFSGKRLLAFAESMTADGAPSGGPKSSC